MIKCIYVSGTEQHAGKTSVSLGLYAAARERGYDTCYFKPVGQRCIQVDDQLVDEDAVVFKHAIDANGDIGDLNPVSIPPGFTREYILHPDPSRTRERIQEAFGRIKDQHELAIVEGTGHAGVGSVIDVSNAHVAAMLGAECVIVSGGGIGRTIDLIALNRGLFQQEGVRIQGAIINKVYEKKYDEVAPIVRQGLKRLRIPCLGLIPYRQQMTFPSLAQIASELDLDFLCAEDELPTEVRSICLAPLAPRHEAERTEDGCLVIFPGTCGTELRAILESHLAQHKEKGPRPAGLVITDGYVPTGALQKVLEKAAIPVLLSDKDPIETGKRVRDLMGKIWEKDASKIHMAREMVRQWVDVDRLFDSIGLS
jgi:hypothetical protein